MTISVNQITVIGHAGDDAEMRETTTGSRYAQFSVATNESWQDSAGEWRKHTEWHTVKVWGEKALRIQHKVKKGSQVYVRGSLKSYKIPGQDLTLWSIKAERVQVEQRGAPLRPNWDHPIK